MSTYDNASLITYPSGYKADKIYSLKPTDGSGDLTFTRASTATRVNSSGLIEAVASNVPRIDYTGGGCGKLLLEPQRTNNYIHSEDFSNAAYNLNNTLVSTNTAVAPDGTSTADTLYQNTDNSQHAIYQTESFTSGTDYLFSWFVKSNGTTQWVQISFSTGFNLTDYCNFDIINGETGNNTGITFGIESYANGWFRIWAKNTATSTTSGVGAALALLQADTAARIPTYTGDGSSGIYIWGAQLEEGSYPTSYIPTAGATATRLVDISSTTGLSSLINSAEGVLFCNVKIPDALSLGFSLTLNDGTINNRVYIGKNAANASIQSIVSIGGVNLVTILGGVYSETDFVKIAIRYKSSETKMFVNGAQIGATNATAFILPTLSNLSFTAFNGQHQSVMVFPTALTDTELIELTTI